MPRYGLYQPFIEDRNVRRLYQLKLEHRRRTGTKLPMTVLINRILDDFFGAEAVNADADESTARPASFDTPPRSSP